MNNTIKVGDKVRIIGGTAEGIVLEVTPDKKNKHLSLGQIIVKLTKAGTVPVLSGVKDKFWQAEKNSTEYFTYYKWTQDLKIIK